MKGRDQTLSNHRSYDKLQNPERYPGSTAMAEKVGNNPAQDGSDAEIAEEMIPELLDEIDLDLDLDLGELVIDEQR